ncbi:HSP20-like chaperone [Lasiosphaeris hirsuta]|uniref:HSP20-like chaperone n=1 Tax=Lasiosphaeris hirsuta TaxID=260670 RepID=A0AA40BAA9_9PEZI|nr:HSP20-like chaperone [Lasiosphaeris hirsuta]
MAWNNNFPSPPPYQGPPGHSGPPGPPGPPRGFWDFIQSFDPNTNHAAAPGFGVDHTRPQAGFQGLPFGPEGFGPWAAGGRGRGRGGWPFGPGGPGRHYEHGHGHSRSHGRHGHGHGRRGRHGSDDDGSCGDEDLYDITTAAAIAEAEMMAEKEKDPEKAAAATAKSPDATMRDANDEAGEHPDPPEEVPCAEPSSRRGRGRGGCGRQFFGGRGRGGHGHGHGHPHHGPPPFGPFGPFSGTGGPLDFNGMMTAFAHHPYAQRVREYVERAKAQAQGARNNDGEGAAEQTFTPPVDIFSTRNGWTLHIAVPGAKKEDIGVHWDADQSTLTVSGVVHRPGDEEFLSGMLSSERRVGLFERKIQLPPAEGNENKDEVDGDHISAKMEDGVLVVVVPKVEKEWTEVKKVDIE